MKATEARVIEIISDTLGANEGSISRTTGFEEAGVDSLDLIEVVMRLEDEFGISIPSEEATRIKTVGQVIEFLEREGVKA